MILDNYAAMMMNDTSNMLYFDILCYDDTVMKCGTTTHCNMMYYVATQMI